MTDDFPDSKKKKKKLKLKNLTYLVTTLHYRPETAAGGKTRTGPLFPLHRITPYVIAGLLSISEKWQL